MSMSPGLVDLPGKGISGSSMADQRNLDDFHEKTSSKISEEACRSSPLDSILSVQVSRCCKTDSTGNISCVEQVASVSGTLFTNTSMSAAYVCSIQYELVAHLIISQDNSSSESPRKSHSQLTTAKVVATDNVSSQLASQSFVSASHSVSNLEVTAAATMLTLTPPNSQGYTIFTATTAKTTDQNKRNEKARPRQSALRKQLTVRSQAKSAQKTVRWSESIQEDIEYKQYRRYLLDLHIPDEHLKSAAVEAVTFMCDTEDGVSESLIDISVKLFWLKHNRYPTCSELWLSLCDNNFDEKTLVLDFIKDCEPNMSLLQ